MLRIIGYGSQLSNIVLPAATLLFLVLFPAVVLVEGGSPYIISDHRVRGMDNTPYLGRGYSIMTNAYHSICLSVDQVTVPSYNYDYSFYDFTSSKDVVSDVRNKMAYSFASQTINKKVTEVTTTTTKTNKKTRIVTASMRIERYYTSVKEDASTLSDDALTLLNRQDYIGFFIACGPTYIRGIRRAQEVFTTFSFESEDVDQTKKFAREIKTQSWKNKVYTYFVPVRKSRTYRHCSGFWFWRRCENRVRHYTTYERRQETRRTDEKTTTENKEYTKRATSEEKSLKIDIQGFGLGLNEEGSESMVATSLNDHNRVMLFAFNTMTRSQDYAHIGMVYGVEVVNWVENIQFQVATAIQDEVIEVPLTLSLIPRSYKVNTDGTQNFDYLAATTTEQQSFICKDPAAVKDKYGFCCTTEALYNIGTKEYNDDVPEERVCRPLRALDPAMLKDNMSANAEFVARLEQLVRYRLNELSTAERCISEVKGIPERYNNNLLRPNPQVKAMEGSLEYTTTVFEMKMALDPFQDFSYVTMLGKELDEYMEMFIRPCYSALFGSNFGNNPDEDPSYFMAYAWYNHDQCSKLSCMATGMRWDRDNPAGGCVPGLVAGVSAQEYGPDGTDLTKACAKELVPIDPNASTIPCKHSSTKMNDTIQSFKKALNNVANVGRIDTYIERYCMPQLEDKKISLDQINTLERKYLALNEWKKMRDFPEYTPQSTELINIALGKPTSSSGVYNYNSFLTSYAVDGNRDGNIWRNSVYHSSRASNSFWQVDLQADYTVEKVIIFNRQDCCSERLSGARVTLYDAAGSTVGNADGYALNGNYEQTISFSTSIQNVRKVKVHHTDNKVEYIQLAEVEVYAQIDILSTLLI